ncbi:ribosome biogenesis GTPase YlqF [Geopsychrobacter electrodiphilus]|uniref:ribosome biogenesis GTPase YlqF n=1 Tax=Geopsychrobacter electrodiphilus TaxID=225196 RepID=UPI0003801861|nr:ribosome biogenesis GTPase YlqF [Geopsychrobacter electrodiphilus]
MKIDWYPGHMKKARELILDLVKNIDLIVEILDARLPQSSANPVLQELRGRRPFIRVLNKDDLADPTVTKAWKNYFEQEEGVKALPLSAKNRSASSSLQNLCRRMVPHRCKPGRPIRVMIVGIPNVGKSTMINTLAGKKMARVGDKPAITTCHQLIDLRNGILLSDTPGLLWPNLEERGGAQRLAISGAIGENAYDQGEIALYALKWLVATYPQLLIKRYKLDDLSGEPADLLATIGSKRGCLISGGEVDFRRSADLLLRDLRGGQLGRLSLETPPLAEAPAA